VVRGSLGCPDTAGSIVDPAVDPGVDFRLLSVAGPATLVLHRPTVHLRARIVLRVLDDPRSPTLAQAERRLYGQKGFLIESLGDR